MIHEKVNFEHYYNGHYIDSGKSREQREEDLKLSLESIILQSLTSSFVGSIIRFFHKPI